MAILKDFLAAFKGCVDDFDEHNNFTCDLCEKEVFANERICAKCRGSLPYNVGVICPFCGRRGREEGTCLACKQKPLGVKKARSVYVHTGLAAGAVVRFKMGDRYLCRALGDELHLMCSREFHGVEGIVAIPMTKKAEERRGYNQAALLAQRLSERWGVPYLNALEKSRETDPQKFLGRRDREENLKDCFRVSDRKAVKGKVILIVDDTMTTGATISAVADVLRRAGAKELYAATLTSVEQKSPLPDQDKE